MMQVKLWSEGYKCMKKRIFCCTESVSMTPKSCAHMRTTSLWEVAVKWPARAPKMKLILGLSDPQRYSRISLSLSGRILKEYQNTVSAAELPELAIRTGKWTIFLTTYDHVLVNLLYCDESTEVSRLIDLKKKNHSATWSNIADPWQNFNEAEFHIFLCTAIEIIITYYFQGCE